MSRKREIKVYLPEKMVGELEGRKRLGTRSKFIQESIQKNLHGISTTTPIDFGLVHLLCTCRDKIEARVGFGISSMESNIYSKMIQIIIDEVNSQ